MARDDEAGRLPQGIFLRLMFESRQGVTDEQIAYFRQHPDQIDEVTAPLNIHRFFLLAGVVVGTLVVGVAKLLEHSGLLADVSRLFEDFLVDVMFEAGVALLGAGITAYLLGVLLNIQQDKAKGWRREIRKRLADP